jgi:hypothetical protein
MFQTRPLFLREQTQFRHARTLLDVRIAANRHEEERWPEFSRRNDS